MWGARRPTDAHLSRPAVARLESYTPTGRCQDLRMTKGGKLNEGIFRGVDDQHPLHALQRGLSGRPGLGIKIAAPKHCATPGRQPGVFEKIRQGKQLVHFTRNPPEIRSSPASALPSTLNRTRSSHDQAACDEGVAYTAAPTPRLPPDPLLGRRHHRKRRFESSSPGIKWAYEEVRRAEQASGMTK